MQEPTSPEEEWTLHNLLRSDPQSYLSIVNERIHADPKNSNAYFDRHFAWMKVGQPQRALSDLDKVIELDQKAHPIVYMSRGEVYRHLGEYENALNDFDHGEAIDPDQWEKNIVFGLLFQADAHARLGDEAAALVCCARLPDDFWTPGIAGAPSGGKADVADKLRRMAADARRKRT
jgi:tetratricopeptide (TPR) repeat protein